MRLFLLGFFTLCALAGQAQTTALAVPEKATAKLEKLLKQTRTAVEAGKRASTLPAETRPVLNQILVQSTREFLAITAGKPTKDAYLQSLDAGLARLAPLVPHTDDRAQVAEHYQDLLDIVGLESSEGRLTAFMEGSTMAAR
ncbi:hypothetical protein BEN47_04055 [Hymenobacter lapidarius]|uniref:DUF4844 domain-containing protein n=1 Tax=Hymenobacter lapidarius TaxID=1908237 RepID=A0A1G1SVD4_9BACT|nr:DUF4844 domain-containing protein [Hymenobacter lapidarius]OGX82566.1 hypothetical protein BEN47_04055 [Hymenobacter lapidarius]